MKAVKFTNPHLKDLGKHIYHSSTLGLKLVEYNSELDSPGVIVCGLGNSILEEEVKEEIMDLYTQGYKIITFKEGITYFKNEGYEVSYAVAMDPGAERQIKKTPVYGDVVYCIASSCHPEFFDHVIKNGGQVRIFHSVCGYAEIAVEPGFVISAGAEIKRDLRSNKMVSRDNMAVVLGQYDMATTEGYEFSPLAIKQTSEIELYRQLFGNADTICGGFTVGNRAIGLAKYMGFDNVVVAGMDFGWRENQSYYASFCKAKNLEDSFMCDNGKVDGKPWWTRPDLLASAVDVAKKAKIGELRIIGSGLAKSLSLKDEEFLDKVYRVSA